MNEALYVAATGMKAQHAQLDAIANNVANVATPSFKRSTLHFTDLVSAPAADPAAASAAPGPGGALAGVAIASMLRPFAPGELRPSDDPMALAIQGDGFLEVLAADGSPAFSRGGRLQVDADRMLATAHGEVLRQRIHVPADLRQVAIAADGQVSGIDDQGREWTLGRIELALFANPAALAPLGDTLYRATAAAGDPLVAPPGEHGAGRLRQGFQEASNVKLVDEMVQLMVAQRAYEMNVKVMQAADEFAGLTNNLRR